MYRFAKPIFQRFNSFEMRKQMHSMNYIQKSNFSVNEDDEIGDFYRVIRNPSAKDFIRAMDFEIPENKAQREQNIRVLVSKLQDRLDEDQLEKFQNNLEAMKFNQIFVKENQEYLKKVKLFALFNQCINHSKYLVKVLDLIPDIMRIELQEMTQNSFHDEVTFLNQELCEYNKKDLETNRFNKFIPSSQPIALSLKVDKPIIETKQQQKKQLETNNILDFQDLKQNKSIEIVDIQMDEIVVENNRDILRQKELATLKLFRVDREARLQKMVSFEEKKLYLKNAQYKLAEKDQMIILKERNFQLIPQERTNFVYCFGLPYDLCLHPEITANLKHYVEQNFGSIKNYQLQDYKDFRLISHDEQAENQTKAIEIHKRLLKSQQLLNRIDTKKKGKFNRSYALIEFESPEAKIKALSKELRVFGVKINDIVVQIEDADYKRSLLVNNISWGNEFGELVNYLQQTLNTEFAHDIQQDLSLTSPYIILRCNSFIQSMRAMKLINTTQFEKQKQLLKVQHYPGNVRSIMHEFYEDLDVIEQRSKFQMMKVNQDRIRQQILREAFQKLPSDQEQEEIHIQLIQSEFPDYDQIEQYFGDDYNNFDYKQRGLFQDEVILS